MVTRSQVLRLLRCLMIVWALELAVGSSAAAQKQPREVHIAVRVQGENGDPFLGLSAKDFVVTANGARIPIALSRPAWNQSSAAHGRVPTRVLIVIATNARLYGEEAKAELMQGLKPFWRKGWQVSVLDRSQTLYAITAAELRSALDLSSGNVTWETALAKMGAFKGQKLILYVTDPGNKVDGSLRAAAWNIQAIVYHVGGNPLDNYGPGFGSPQTVDSIVNYHPGTPDVSIPTVPNYWLRVGNLREERSLAAARRDMFYDALGYYDLEFPLADDVRRVNLKITRGTRQRITAECYSDGATPPELTLEQDR